MLGQPPRGKDGDNNGDENGEKKDDGDGDEKGDGNGDSGKDDARQQVEDMLDDMFPDRVKPEDTTAEVGTEQKGPLENEIEEQIKGRGRTAKGPKTIWELIGDLLELFGGG